jgi:hypothetical protein
LVVQLRGPELTIAGRPISVETRELQRALFTFAPGASVIDLRGHVGNDEQSLRPVLRELAHGPVPLVRVALNELRIDLQSRLFLRGETGTVLNGYSVAGGIELQIRGERLESLQPGSDESEAAASAALRKACWPGPCSAALWLTDDAPLVSSLSAWKRVLGDVPTTLLIRTRPVGSAHIPPPAVRHTVHDHFPSLRDCYDRGRARDPHLLGDVIVRFVLEVDGRPSHVENAGGNLPDDYAVTCVLRAFERLVFPRPDAPISIEYPIAFTPGG